MPVAVTYEWYSQTYGGGLSESAFELSLPAATRHVRWLVGGSEPSDEELESYQRAVCAAVDAFAEFGEGQVGGFSLGDFKVTHYEDEGTRSSLVRHSSSAECADAGAQADTDAAAGR